MEILRRDESFMDCPARDCKGGFIFDSRCSYVKCIECDTDICIRCKEIMHKGISCETYQEIKNGDDKSEQWKKEKTKKCPNARCGVPIEKNDGCPHMT